MPTTDDSKAPDLCIWCGERPAVHSKDLCDRCLDREWRWANRVVQRHEEDEVEEPVDVTV
jgi:hypothetical protein